MVLVIAVSGCVENVEINIEQDSSEPEEEPADRRGDIGLSDDELPDSDIDSSDSTSGAPDEEEFDDLDEELGDIETDSNDKFKEAEEEFDDLDEELGDKELGDIETDSNDKFEEAEEEFDDLDEELGDVDSNLEDDPVIEEPLNDSPEDTSDNDDLDDVLEDTEPIEEFDR